MWSHSTLTNLWQTHRNTLHVTASTFTPTMKMWKSQSIIAVMSTTVFPCIWTFHHWGVYPTVTACWLSYCHFIAVLMHFEDSSCKFVAHSCNQNWCFEPTLKEFNTWLREVNLSQSCCFILTGRAKLWLSWRLSSNSHGLHVSTAQQSFTE